MHVVGTAGHVDHGKSSLVKMLTGIDPDRLAEEKEREMTIDLGFAWFNLGDEAIGVVDVPGHRDFIENMLAGVGGIDLALLVIAADEGVMPQTREHLAILDLLGVSSGIVALTKTDLIDDPEWIDLISLDIGLALEGSTLEGAPIVPVSSRTQAGLTELRQVLSEKLALTEQRPDAGRARLPIDRVFTLSGFGTVVTGTLLDGSLRVGDAVEIAPDGYIARIRGLQTHKTKRDIAWPGSRVAVNLTGVVRQDLRRGQVVSLPGQLRPTTLIDVSYRHLAGANQPLKHSADVKVFVGAAEVAARARVLGQETIEPGESGWLQLSLSSPMAIVRGDRYILRRPSPGETIGGGVILDANPGRRHRRFRPEVLARFEALQAGTPEEIVMQTLRRAGPVETTTLIEWSSLSPSVAAPALEQLASSGQLQQIGKFVLATTAWVRLGEEAKEMVRAYHTEFPLRQGMNREELRSRLKVPAAIFNPLIAEAIEQDNLVERGALLSLTTHVVTFAPEQQLLVNRLILMLEESRVNSPSVLDCKSVVGDPLYHSMVEQGTLTQVGKDVVYRTQDYGAIMTSLQKYMAENGSITAAQARDFLETSRKYAIAWLEHLDELRVTRRVGDERVLTTPKLP